MADGILAQAIAPLPQRGRVRVALDWTIEDAQHLLVLSLLVKGRAIPVFWRGYEASFVVGTPGDCLAWCRGWMTGQPPAL